MKRLMKEAIYQVEENEIGDINLEIDDGTKHEGKECEDGLFQFKKSPKLQIHTTLLICI